MKPHPTALVQTAVTNNAHWKISSIYNYLVATQVGGNSLCTTDYVQGLFSSFFVVI
jgi:hypothetical protein